MKTTTSRKRTWVICATRLITIGLLAATLAPAAFAANHPLAAASPDTCEASTSTAFPRQADPHGAKSYLIKQAVKLIAAALRKGGDMLTYLIKWLDDDAAKAISKHNEVLADGLERIARIPDLSTQLVKEKTFHVLTGACGLPGGTALQISDAVAATINWLIF